MVDWSSLSGMKLSETTLYGSGSAWRRPWLVMAESGRFEKAYETLRDKGFKVQYIVCRRTIATLNSPAR